jgi:hypothetical protein
MANHLRGEVAIKALGQDLIFRLGVNEMLELQNALGLADRDDVFLSVFDEDKLRNLKTIRTIFVYGLKRPDQSLTEEEVGNIVTELGLSVIPGIVKEALRWALPEKEETPPGGEPRPSAGPTSS